MQGRIAGAEDFRGEALTTVVTRRNLIGIEFSRLQGKRHGSAVHFISRIKAAIPYAGIHPVIPGHGRGLQRIFCGSPAQDRFALDQVHLEGMHRQRLHGIFAAVARAQILEHAFVYGAGGRKAERGIQAVAHIGKIQMGQQFQQKRRHIGRAALAVGAVPQLPARPGRFIQRPDVIHNLRLHQVGVQTAVHAVFPVRKLREAFVGAGIDSQRADDGVVRGYSGVGMPGQRKVHGHLPGYHFLHPGAAASIVFGIVIVPVVKQGAVNSSVLQLVQRPLHEGGHSGNMAAALHLAHSAAEADSIGRYNPGR